MVRSRGAYTRVMGRPTAAMPRPTTNWNSGIRNHTLQGARGQQARRWWAKEKKGRGGGQGAPPAVGTAQQALGRGHAVMQASVVQACRRAGGRTHPRVLTSVAWGEVHTPR